MVRSKPSYAGTRRKLLAVKASDEALQKRQAQSARAERARAERDARAARRALFRLPVAVKPPPPVSASFLRKQAVMAGRNAGQDLSLETVERLVGASVDLPAQRRVFDAVQSVLNAGDRLPSDGFCWDGDVLAFDVDGMRPSFLKLPIVGDNLCCYYCIQAALIAADSMDEAAAMRMPPDADWGDIMQVIVSVIDNPKQSRYTRLLVFSRNRSNAHAFDTSDVTEVWGTYARDVSVGPDDGEVLLVLNTDEKHFDLAVLRRGCV